MAMSADAIRQPLIAEAVHDTMELRDNWRTYLELRLRVLMTELNWVRLQLGENPRRCPHCGEMLK